MSASESQAWRTEEELEDGSVVVKCVTVTPGRKRQDGEQHFLVETTDGRRRETVAPCARDAIVEVAASERWRIVGLLAPGTKTRLELSEDASRRANKLPWSAAAFAAALAQLFRSIMQEDPCADEMDAFGRRRQAALRAHRLVSSPCPSCGIPTLLVSVFTIGAPDAEQRRDNPRPGSTCAVCRRMAHPVVWWEAEPGPLSVSGPSAAWRTR